MNKNSYKIRGFEPKDFSTVANWLYSWNIKEFDKDLFPETSYLVEYNDKPILFGSFYKTNSKGLGFVENFVGDRELNNERHFAVGLLMNHIEAEAKKEGYKVLVGFIAEKKLRNNYEEFGFVPTTKNYSSVIKII